MTHDAAVRPGLIQCVYVEGKEKREFCKPLRRTIYEAVKLYEQPARTGYKEALKMVHSAEGQ